MHRRTKSTQVEVFKNDQFTVAGPQVPLVGQSSTADDGFRKDPHLNELGDGGLRARRFGPLLLQQRLPRVLPPPMHHCLLRLKLSLRYGNRQECVRRRDGGNGPWQI